VRVHQDQDTLNVIFIIVIIIPIIITTTDLSGRCLLEGAPVRLDLVVAVRRRDRHLVQVHVDVPVINIIIIIIIISSSSSSSSLFWPCEDSLTCRTAACQTLFQSEACLSSLSSALSRS
jgi:hypothetical protein